MIGNSTLKHKKRHKRQTPSQQCEETATRQTFANQKQGPQQNWISQPLNLGPQTQLPEVRDINFCCLSYRLWYFLIVAQGTKTSSTMVPQGSRNINTDDYLLGWLNAHKTYTVPCKCISSFKITSLGGKRGVWKQWCWTEHFKEPWKNSWVKVHIIKTKNKVFWDKGHFLFILF